MKEESKVVFATKLANKLGLDYNTVDNAVRADRKEMLNDALSKRLQQAVSNGRITQDQANEILQWMENRPAALGQLSGHGFGLGLGSEDSGPMIGHHHGWWC